MRDNVKKMKQIVAVMINKVAIVRNKIALWVIKLKIWQMESHCEMWDRPKVAAHKKVATATPEETLMKSGTFSLNNNKQASA